MGPFQPGVSFGLGMAYATHGHIWSNVTSDPLTARDKDVNSSAQRDFGPVKGLSYNLAR